MVPACALVASVLVSIGAYAQQQVRVADAATQAAIAFELGGDASATARAAIGGSAASKVAVHLAPNGTLRVSTPLSVGGLLGRLYPQRISSVVHVTIGGVA